jgi:hypothetical protein
VLKAAKITFSNQSVIDCTVRNMSQTGACLEIATASCVPSAFMLSIGGDMRARNCRVAWARATRMGVSFQ